MKRVNKKICSRVVFKLYSPKAINKVRKIGRSSDLLPWSERLPKTGFRTSYRSEYLPCREAERALVAKGDLFST